MQEQNINTPNNKKRNKSLPFRLTIATIAISIMIMIAKITAYIITGSNIIWIDAMESTVNIVASFFALLALYISYKPRDSGHPYGHGKIEFFSVGLEGGMIVVAGLLVIGKIANELINEHKAIEKLDIGTIIVALTAIANYIWGRILIYQGKKLNSPVLLSDGKHLSSDGYTTIFATVVLIIVYTTRITIIDKIGAIIIGIYLCFTGGKLLKEFIDRLMDRSNPEVINQISQILENNRAPYQVDIHNLKTQQFGSNIHIDIHLRLPYFWTIKRAHDATVEVELLLKQELNFVDADVAIHADACDFSHCNYCPMVECSERKEKQKFHRPMSPKNLTMDVDNLIDI